MHEPSVNRDTEGQIQRLVAFLDERFGVDALWIFGSEAAGRAREGSDLDVAALFVRRPTPYELLEAEAEASAWLDRPVDLVSLDAASPILAMQVLRHGRLMVDRNPRRRIRFVAGVPGRYEDVIIMQRPIIKAMMERFEHGRP